MINSERDILPATTFHNAALSSMPTDELRRDYQRMVLATSSSSKSQVFSFLATVPMLFGPDAKRRLVRVDATDRMHSTIGAASQRLLQLELPELVVVFRYQKKFNQTFILR